MNIFKVGPRVLESVHDETARLYHLFGDEHAADSQAGRELTLELGRSIVQTAFSQGAMLLEVTADQVGACRRSLLEPVLTVAPWTTARSAMESCALGCWLMDSTITRTERMARSFAFRYEGLRQQQKLLRTTGAGQEAAAEAVGGRIQTVEANAIELGFEPLRGKRNEIIGIGQSMPSITDLTATVLSHEEEYRLFSAVAHAHFWALSSLSLQVRRPPVETGEPSETVAGGQPYLEKHLLPTSAMLVVSEALEYLSRIVWVRFVLFGWPTDELLRILERAYDTIGMSDSTRFWQ